MVPFDIAGEEEVTWIQAGNFTVDSPVTAKLLEQRHSERLYPDKPLVTTQRIIDTFFPIALGGTGCIPGGRSVPAPTNHTKQP